MTFFSIFEQSTFAYKINKNIYIKQKGKTENDSVFPSRPSLVLFRSYKLDSASLGLSNIR